MCKICLDPRRAVFLQKTWRVDPGRFCPSFVLRKHQGQNLLQKHHGRNLPGSTRRCFPNYGSSVFQKTYGDTACDLSFWELSFPQKRKGDPACDLSFWELSFRDTTCDLLFWELSFSKNIRGHCLQFVIWELDFKKNLRLQGTLLAICHFGSSVLEDPEGPV